MLKKILKFTLWELTGLRLLWEKFLPPIKTEDYRPPSQFIVIVIYAYLLYAFINILMELNRSK